MPERKDRERPDAVVDVLQRFATASEDLSRAFGAHHGMHHTAARAIVELMESAAAGAPMTAGGLGAALDLSPASVTALVDRMVAAGHVRREPDPTDRRRVHLVVEPAAVALGEEYFRPLGEDLGALAAGFSARDLAVIERFLGGAIETIRAHLASPPSR